MDIIGKQKQKKDGTGMTVRSTQQTNWFAAGIVCLIVLKHDKTEYRNMVTVRTNLLAYS